MKEESTYIKFLVATDFTKHIGGFGATKTLAELCLIGKDSYVLDVGCGVGRSTCWVAKRYGCRMVGVDISPSMIERAKARAKQMGLDGQVEFRVADAQKLPFKNGQFDVVLAESVLVFVPDKKKAMGEYVRVCKPGGYVGINEETCLKTPLSEEVVEYHRKTFSFGVSITITKDYWTNLMKGAGLKDITSQVFRVTLFSEFLARLESPGPIGILKLWLQAFSMALKSPEYKKFVKSALSLPKGYMEYVGYGLYSGRK